MGTKRPIITLTTDFGTKDPFVGQMKGVILRINPDAEIIDITHDISPFNIREGAVVIGLSYQYFPPHTVHLAVVDPGVGSGRNPILVSSGNHYFVGPDNGLFSLIYAKEKESLNVMKITAGYYFLKKDSPTFQGRDIFAPVAGWLSKGIPAANFGERIDGYISLHIPEPEKPTERTLEGEVIYIDRFGNAITNIPCEALNAYLSMGSNVRVVVKGRDIRMKKHYAEAEERDLYCLFNSFGLLEFFVYRGNASGEFGLAVGDIVSVILP